MKNRIGDKYGKLTIIGFSHVKDRNYFWLCRCECGKEKVIQYTGLYCGKVKSCGCSSKDGVTKHGFRYHKIYKAYQCMIQRCYYTKQPNFKYWGGRGITVCDEWKENRVSFFEWALKNGWETGLQLDRINNNGNYEPSNCRFVTSSENNRNKRPKIKKNEAIKF